MFLFYLFFLLCTIIRPKIRSLIDLHLLFAHDHSARIYGPLSCNLSFVHDHSTKNQGPHQFISFMCTRPFDQKLGSSLIYFFYFHTTIRPNYMVLFHLFFVQCTIIRSKIRVLVNLFFILVHDHSTKVRGHSYSLIYYCFNCANISFAIFMADTAL